MNNTEITELHNKTTRIWETAMLLLLRRLLRDTTTFCAIEKIREPMTTEKRHRKWSLCKRERVQAKTISQIKKQASICASRKTRPRKPTARVPTDYCNIYINFSLQRVNRLFAFSENYSAPNASLAAVYCKVAILLRLLWHTAKMFYAPYRSVILIRTFVSLKSRCINLQTKLSRVNVRTPSHAYKKSTQKQLMWSRSSGMWHHVGWLTGINILWELAMSICTAEDRNWKIIRNAGTSPSTPRW
jgi:hypothetical protein